MPDQKMVNNRKIGEITCDPKDKSRRSALKKLLVGAGVLAGYQVLPKRWATPIIEQVVLPAHAQTSGLSIHDPCESSLVSGNQDSVTVIINVKGYISPATANIPITIVATVTGGTGESTTNHTMTDASGNYSINMIVNGGPGITFVSVLVTASGVANSGRCSVDVPDVSSPRLQQDD